MEHSLLFFRRYHLVTVLRKDVTRYNTRMVRIRIRRSLCLRLLGKVFIRLRFIISFHSADFPFYRSYIIMSLKSIKKYRKNNINPFIIHKTPQKITPQSPHKNQPKKNNQPLIINPLIINLIKINNKICVTDQYTRTVMQQ